MSVKFKALCYNNKYVQFNSLSKGLHITNKPDIFELTETIDSLRLKIKQTDNLIGNKNSSIIRNLNKCTMETIEIWIVEN